MKLELEQKVGISITIILLLIYCIYISYHGLFKYKLLNQEKEISVTYDELFKQMQIDDIDTEDNFYNEL